MKWSISLVAVVAVAIASCRKPSAPRVHELAPDPAVVHYKLAIQPAAELDLVSTIAALEHRIDAKIASPFDLADLAEAYVQTAQLSGDPDAYDKAEALARRSLEQLPFPNGVAVVLAKIENARHEFREAIEIAEAFAAHKPSAGAQIVLASAHLALGELDQATAAAEQAVVIKPDSASYLMRALVLEARGRDAEAAFDFTRATVVELPGDVHQSARTRTLWGRFLLRRGEIAGARMLFDEALRIVPAWPLALAQQGELAVRTGHPQRARALFERAFATSRQVRYLIDYARAQELAGDAAGADSSRAQVEQIIRAELGARGTGHKLDLVEVLADRGHLALAVELAREELVHRPSPEARFQLARALYRSGTRAEASTQMHAALASGVRDARFYELASRLEDGPRKELYAREARKLDPSGAGWRGLGMQPR